MAVIDLLRVPATFTLMVWLDNNPLLHSSKMAHIPMENNLSRKILWTPELNVLEKLKKTGLIIEMG